MYLILDDKRTITVPPVDLGPFFDARVIGRLHHEVTGSLSQKCDGIIIHIFSDTIKKSSYPIVNDYTCDVEVDIQYRCIVFCAFQIICNLKSWNSVW